MKRSVSAHVSVSVSTGASKDMSATVSMGAIASLNSSKDARVSTSGVILYV